MEAFNSMWQKRGYLNRYTGAFSAYIKIRHFVHAGNFDWQLGKQAHSIQFMDGIKELLSLLILSVPRAGAKSWLESEVLLIVQEGHHLFPSISQSLLHLLPSWSFPLQHIWDAFFLQSVLNPSPMSPLCPQYSSYPRRNKDRILLSAAVGDVNLSQWLPHFPPETPATLPGWGSSYLPTLSITFDLLKWPPLHWQDSSS